MLPDLRQLSMRTLDTGVLERRTSRPASLWELTQNRTLRSQRNSRSSDSLSERSSSQSEELSNTALQEETANLSQRVEDDVIPKLKELQEFAMAQERRITELYEYVAEFMESQEMRDKPPR
jgi:hypothetical protein